jgi:hypothetical protein
MQQQAQRHLRPSWEIIDLTLTAPAQPCYQPSPCLPPSPEPSPPRPPEPRKPSPPSLFLNPHCPRPALLSTLTVLAVQPRRGRCRDEKPAGHSITCKRTQDMYSHQSHDTSAWLPQCLLLSGLATCPACCCCCCCCCCCRASCCPSQDAACVDWQQQQPTPQPTPQHPVSYKQLAAYYKGGLLHGREPPTGAAPGVCFSRGGKAPRCCL